jgi:Uma2 family endonuclease
LHLTTRTQQGTPITLKPFQELEQPSSEVGYTTRFNSRSFEISTKTLRAGEKERIIAMALTTKWTTEDYHRMIEAGILEGRHVELLDGDIVDMPPEGTPHAAYSQEAADYLRALLGSRAKIREAKPITLGIDSEPEPDIAVVTPHSIEVYLDHHPYPEDIFWLIEFSNTSLSKDLEVKNKLYARANIQEYWVINLQKMQLIILREPGRDGYSSRVELTQGNIQPIAFSDITISVQRLFSR